METIQPRKVTCNMPGLPNANQQLDSAFAPIDIAEQTSKTVLTHYSNLNLDTATVTISWV